jgi:hypothetical protein
MLQVSRDGRRARRLRREDDGDRSFEGRVHRARAGAAERGEQRVVDRDLDAVRRDDLAARVDLAVRIGDLARATERAFEDDARLATLRKGRALDLELVPELDLSRRHTLELHERHERIALASQKKRGEREREGDTAHPPVCNARLRNGKNCWRIR